MEAEQAIIGFTKDLEELLIQYITQVDAAAEQIEREDFQSATLIGIAGALNFEAHKIYAVITMPDAFDSLAETIN